MTEFDGTDLSNARFDRVNLTNSRFFEGDLTGARFKGTYFENTVLRGVEMINVDITGDLEGVTVNGVEIAPLIEAELNRREPDRLKLRPVDPQGYREAWQLLTGLWAETEARARSLPPELLHEQVDDEWSFIETLRHLVFATDSWLRRAIQGDPAPWHSLGLPWDEMPDIPGVPCDRTARPDLDPVLELRRDRQAGMSAYLDTLTPELLDSDTKPLDEPGWPGWPTPRSYQVKQCLRVIFNEEWQHRHFAERDLAILAARTAGDGARDAVKDTADN